jgi:hypothetical protein
MAIDVGTLVEAVTATGERVRLRAVGRPTRGRDFPVVWVCTEEEFQEADQGGRPAKGLPWPLDAIEAVAD